MSEENVELVRTALASYNRGEVDALIEINHPEVEYVTLLMGNHQGKEAIRRLMVENRETLSGYRLEPEELIDAGEQVVAVVRLGGAGRVSQIALGDAIAFLITIKDGLVLRLESFSSREDALDAAAIPRVS